MIHRNCTATATEIRYFEAIDVGLYIAAVLSRREDYYYREMELVPLDAVADVVLER